MSSHEKQKAESILAPSIETRWFRLPYLSTTENGLAFEQRQAESRTESIDKSRGFLSSEQRVRLSNGVKSEMHFQGVEELRQVKRDYKEALEAGDEDVVAKQEAFLAVRDEFIGKGKKVGMRAIELSGDILSADTFLVDFPTYNTIARPEGSMLAGTL